MVDFWYWKRTLKVRILQSLRGLFIILVDLTMTSFNEKMLLSNTCLRGLMPNLIQKSVTVSTVSVSFYIYVFMQYITFRSNIIYIIYMMIFYFHSGKKDGTYIQSRFAVRSGKKSSNQDLGNRGRLKVLNDTKLTLND